MSVIGRGALHRILGPRDRRARGPRRSGSPKPSLLEPDDAACNAPTRATARVVAEPTSRQAESSPRSLTRTPSQRENDDDLFILSWARSAPARPCPPWRP